MITLLPHILSRRTRAALSFDWLRLKARLKRTLSPRKPAHHSRCLHLGCGRKRIDGWLNIDVSGSDFDIDLAGPLPFGKSSFDVVASQQVIEHLELETELSPLLAELNRILSSDGELWLSCPDMAKVCMGYVTDTGQSLMRDRLARWPNTDSKQLPSQHIINILFHQDGQHKNLFDFELLRAVLCASGFVEVQKSSEAEFNRRFPEFPPRNDDAVALYVKARRG